VAYPHLSVLDKLRAIPALIRALLLDPDRRRDSLERQTFGDWLREHGQGPRAIRNLWDLIGLPTLNDSVEAASAYMGLKVFREGLLRTRHGGDIGYARVGLTALVSDAAHRYITARGGEIVPGRSVAGIVVQDGRATGVELAGASGGPPDALAADAVVCATPWDALPGLLPSPWISHPAFEPARGLEVAPIVGIHIWYDRPVMVEEFTAVLDSPVQWVFNRSRIQGLDGPGQYVCISLSGAWEFAPMGKDALRDLFLAEMARLFPAARAAAVERFITVKQLAATFRSTPGAEAHRLPQRTPIAGLALAGDWTQTGWPSTMESAVRSGGLAAKALEEEEAWRE
jgi:squalene-associated FAD-dependent desaturase